MVNKNHIYKQAFASIEKLKLKKLKKLNQNQLLGIVLILISTSASFFFESTLMDVLFGALAAVGVGFALKWIPFKKQNS